MIIKGEGGKDQSFKNPLQTKWKQMDRGPRHRDRESE